MSHRNARKPKIVETQTWRPPKAPARARETHSATPVTLRLCALPGAGPEDVALAPDGHMYSGLEDGRILHLAPDGSYLETIADTSGRPLGVEVDPDGDLVVCDAYRGVLSIDPRTGAVRTIVDRIAGVPMMLCDNSSIAQDGTIYFSDSSTRFDLAHYKGELIAHSGSGRVFRRTPDGAVDLVGDGFHFANGVALAPDESWVAIAETGGYCVTKVWLTGERAGQRETVVDNLPAFPDNLSIGSDGLLWVALPSRRDAVLDLLLPCPPAIRRLAWAMPDALQPKPHTTVWVQAYDTEGRLVHDLQTEHRGLATITGVRERDGVVWLGSLSSPAIGRIDLA
jgi:sugar lactone lactonase YvrE